MLIQKIRTEGALARGRRLEWLTVISRNTFDLCKKYDLPHDSSTHLVEGNSDALTQLIELRRREVAAKTRIRKVPTSNR